MDPLSISAGVVGFLGFVVQVAHLVSKVKSAVQQFKSATTDVEELIGKLAIIEIICGMVKVNLERGQETFQGWLPLHRLFCTHCRRHWSGVMRH